MSSYEKRQAMVENQLKPRGIKDQRLLESFLAVPREPFVSEELKKSAYQDRPLPIGEGQTISQPYIVAYMLDKLEIAPDDKVLEVGSGCGYVLALLAELTEEVYGIERKAALAERSRQTLKQLGYDKIEIRAGDGSRGWPEKAPFAGILVSAAATRVPEELKEQLKIGGRIILPLGDGLFQRLVLITRVSSDEFSRKKLEAVRFVPLIEE